MRIPGLTQDWSNAPDDNGQASDNIGGSPPGCQKGRSNICDLSPVKSQGEHPEARSDPKLVMSATFSRYDKDESPYKV